MAYKMSDDEREKAFPVHVELGDEGPVVDLGDVARMVQIPESGCALVDFVRNEDGTLSIKTVCFEGAAEAEKDIGDELREMAEDADEEGGVE